MAFAGQLPRMERMSASRGLKVMAVAVLAGLWFARPAAADGAPPTELAARLLGNLRVLAVPQGEQGARVARFLAPDGKPAAESAAATVRWNDAGLTVIFECNDEAVVAVERPRDQVAGGRLPDRWRLPEAQVNDDTVAVLLDIGRKRNQLEDSWVQVSVNAAGAIFDERGPLQFVKRSGDPRHGDRAWNLEGLKTEVAKTAAGWRAEIFLPWDGLGGRPATGEVWGFNLARGNLPAKEFSYWTPPPEPWFGPHYNPDLWGSIWFIEQSPEKDAALLAGLFHDLRVLPVPRGAPGAALDRFRTLLDTPAAAGARAELRWDDAGLTAAVDCRDGKIKAEKRARDDAQIWRDDSVELFLDPGYGRNARASGWRHLIVNAAGAVLDERGPMEWYAREYSDYTGSLPPTPKGGDTNWNLAGLKIKAAATADGWRAEIFLPWDGLGGAPQAGDAWGFNLARVNWPEEELVCFAPTASFLHNLERWGALVFLDRQLDLPPPATARPAPRPGKAPKPGENLLFNGSFDQQLSGWTIFPAEGNRSPRYQKNDEHQSEGKIIIPASRKNVLVLSSPYGRAESPPFALDPAGRYRFALDMQNVHWNARAFVDGYRWKPGVKKHSGEPKPEELQKVWRSRPLIYRAQPARNLREQNFCYPPGKWATAALEFPDPDATVSERRAWNEAEFGRVYLDAPLGGGNFSYGYVYVDDAKVERVE